MNALHELAAAWLEAADADDRAATGSADQRAALWAAADARRECASALQQALSSARQASGQ